VLRHSFTERLEDKLDQAETWLEWARRNLMHHRHFNEIDVVARAVDETRRPMIRHRPTNSPLDRQTGVKCFGCDSLIWPCLELTRWSSIWLDDD
jgi:hypothetical protein